MLQLIEDEKIQNKRKSTLNAAKKIASNYNGLSKYCEFGFASLCLDI